MQMPRSVCIGDEAERLSALPARLARQGCPRHSRTYGVFNLASAQRRGALRSCPSSAQRRNWRTGDRRAAVSIGYVRAGCQVLKATGQQLKALGRLWDLISFSEENE